MERCVRTYVAIHLNYRGHFQHVRCLAHKLLFPVLRHRAPFDCNPLATAEAGRSNVYRPALRRKILLLRFVAGFAYACWSISTGNAQFTYITDRYLGDMMAMRSLFWGPGEGPKVRPSPS